ncbi:plasmid mobilization protein [Streptomyces sp. NPDC021224]|uniref:plasmid mobilization protein n=1 Tax=unclassified Streptomyces TaxID=2593676 RepID=UPI0037B1FA3C
MADDQPHERTPPFPDRKPRRRARNPTERAYKLTVRLSDTERTEIAAAARLHALTPAGFLATAGMAAARGQVSVRPDRQLAAAVDELAALRTAISRVGNNVNQIAHVHNAVGQPLPVRLDRALRTLLDVLARIDAAADALVSRRS